jgi:hypothetical protein
MTANELIHKLNTEFGLDKKWPETYEVDAETYANCCKFLFKVQFNNNMERIIRKGYGDLSVIEFIIGKNKEPMFKNVELILK